MTASPKQVGDYVANWINDDKWTETYVAFDDPSCYSVTLKFSDRKPRRFMAVSKDSFATMDKVTIYEIAHWMEIATPEPPDVK